MAEIYLSMAEIMDILAANKLLPPQISQIEIDDNMVSFRYHTNLAFPAHIDISVQFLKFENEIAELEISTSWLVEKVLKHLAVFKQDFIRLEGARLYVNIIQLMKNKLNGLNLKKIDFINHRFQIVFYTTH